MVQESDIQWVIHRDFNGGWGDLGVRIGGKIFVPYAERSLLRPAGQFRPLEKGELSLTVQTDPKKKKWIPVSDGLDTSCLLIRDVLYIFD